MITINSIKYKSYIEMCNVYNISYTEFIQFKRRNKELSEFGILAHFIPNLAYNMTLGYVTTNKAYNPFGKQIIPIQKQVATQQLRLQKYDYYGIPYGYFDTSEEGEGYKSKKRKRQRKS